MRPQTSFKLLLVALLALFFAGFMMRAALRLASAAMHSIFVTVLLAIVIVWIIAKLR